VGEKDYCQKKGGMNGGGGLGKAETGSRGGIKSFCLGGRRLKKKRRKNVVVGPCWAAERLKAKMGRFGGSLKKWQKKKNRKQIIPLRNSELKSRGRGGEKQEKPWFYKEGISEREPGGFEGVGGILQGV